MGVGTNSKNISEWVNEIWQYYVKKNDELLRRDEFIKFVKNMFRATSMDYQP